jgi:hypothetical protein
MMIALVIAFHAWKIDWAMFKLIICCLSTICSQHLFVIPHAAKRAGSRIRGQASELVLGRGIFPYADKPA